MSDHITVEKRDPDVYPTFVQQYVTGGIYNNSLIVESEGRYTYVSYEDIYEYEYGDDYFYTGNTEVSFGGEGALTGAIDYVISETLPKMYMLTGHGEKSMSASFQSAVEKQNIEMSSLSADNGEYSGGCRLHFDLRPGKGHFRVGKRHDPEVFAKRRQHDPDHRSA